MTARNGKLAEFLAIVSSAPTDGSEGEDRSVTSHPVGEIDGELLLVIFGC